MDQIQSSDETENMGTLESRRPLMSLPPLVSQTCPWLLFRNGKQEEKQTFFSLSQDQCYTRMIPEMENKIILCSSSSSGWLVLMDSNGSQEHRSCYFLLNLESLEKLQLATLDMDYPDSVLMTATPPNGHIVFFKKKLDNDEGTENNTEKCRLQFCRPGDKEFWTKSFDHLPKYDADGLTAFGGRIFWLKSDWSFLMLDVVGSTLQLSELVVQQIPTKLLARPRVSSRCLVEHLGEILLVYSFSFDAVPWHFDDYNICRFDSSAKAWVEVRDIGKNAILIDAENYGICCAATDESGIRANSVYYVDGCYLHVFDLEDRSITTYLPCPTLSLRRQPAKWVVLPTINKLEDLKLR